VLRDPDTVRIVAIRHRGTGIPNRPEMTCALSGGTLSRPPGKT
jgi:hypothetical protein